MGYKLEALSLFEMANACAFLGNVLANRQLSRAGIIGMAAEGFSRISQTNVNAVLATRPGCECRTIPVDEIVLTAMTMKSANLPKALRTFQRLASCEKADNGENHQTATTKEFVMLLQGRALDAVVFTMFALEHSR